MTFGKTWLRVPETFLVRVEGQLPRGVYSKDIILRLIGEISSRGATYKALEFVGSTIEGLSIDGRSTLGNMSVEAGAKVGIVPPDEVTRRFLEGMGRGIKYRALASDTDAAFERTIEFRAQDLEPLVACPHQVDNVKPVGEVEGTRVDMVWLGSSCNGSSEPSYSTSVPTNPMMDEASDAFQELAL